MVKYKWAAIIGTVLLTSALVASAAFANAANNAPGQPKSAQKGVRPQPTEAEKELMTQIKERREAHAEQLKAEVKAILDQAVANGTVTQEQADRLLKPAFPGASFMQKRQALRGEHRKAPEQFRGKMQGKMQGKVPGKRKLPFGPKLTAEQITARLEAAVAAGKMSQEQADQLLQRWQEHQSQTAPQN